MGSRTSTSDVALRRSSAHAPMKPVKMDKNEGARHLESPTFSPPSYDLERSPYSSEPSPTGHMKHEPCLAPNQTSPINAGSSHGLRTEAASLDPPITIHTLSELDDDHLSSNLLLRHDLNFDPKIQYRPRTQGHQGEQRITKAVVYWDAMRTEIAGWFIDQEHLSVCESSSCCCWTSLLPHSRDRNSLGTRLLRLPRMFVTVRDILKSLTPTHEWPAIDARLDIELLVQELENGVCDFLALSEWLGSIMRRFCLPGRSHLIDLMTSTIFSGVQNNRPLEIVHGLTLIFDVLEIMKLDSANQTIRSLRPAMVDTTVVFEQKDFLRRIEEGWDIGRAHTWFVKERQERRSPSGLLTLGPTIADLIINNADDLPPTFTLDYIRLRTLQSNFESLFYQAACKRTFEESLRSLKWEASIPQRCYDDLFARISTITSDEEVRCNRSRQSEDVTLEIVREAYKLCKIRRVPSTQDTSSAESSLSYSCDPSSGAFQDLKNYLADDLHDMIEEEVDTIRDYTPMQTSNRYAPEGSTEPPQTATEQTELCRMAQQIAHISVLHWRVWAPILYEQPGDA